jgi:hypothetical protein
MDDIEAILYIMSWLIWPAVLAWGYVMLRRRKGVRASRIALAVYIALYCILSATGNYATANHGGMDWRQEWCPRFLVRTYITIRVHAELTPLGNLYWPCVLIDRLVWHPTGWSE